MLGGQLVSSTYWKVVKWGEGMLCGPQQAHTPIPRQSHV